MVSVLTGGMHSDLRLIQHSDEHNWPYLVATGISCYQWESITYFGHFLWNLPVFCSLLWQYCALQLNRHTGQLLFGVSTGSIICTDWEVSPGQQQKSPASLSFLFCQLICVQSLSTNKMYHRPWLCCRVGDDSEVPQQMFGWHGLWTEKHNRSLTH